MSLYAIGIGGTGAKCIESLIHMSAIGLFPDNQELHILFVDPDGANGSLGRTGVLLENYKNCKSNKIEGTDFLKTTIKTFQPTVWSPLGKNVKKLKDFVGYSNLSDDYRHLFDVLFSPQERETNLEKGFRGHPSIGATIMAPTIELDTVEPWATMQQQILRKANNETKPKVMLFGSIFGGTGAAGFPTIARILKNWADKDENDSSPFFLSGVLMLPYFSFDKVKGGDENEMHADSRDFLLNTQGALLYYEQQKYEEKFDSVYILGSDDLRKTRVAKLGGNEQENDPHWTELYAALATVKFFGEEKSDKQPYHMISREESNRLNWQDLPQDDTQLKQKILQMTRFAFAYLSTYYPMLVEISETNKDEYRAPWYVNFFKFRDILLKDCLEKELVEVKDYCEKFLLWFANIEFSITGTRLEGISKNLVDFSSFADISEIEDGEIVKLLERFSLDGFNNFVLPEMNRKDAGLDSLWERMCDTNPKDKNAKNAWVFINELYRQCGIPK